MVFHKVLDGVYEVTTDLGQDIWQRCLEELTACQVLGINHHDSQPDLGAKDILVKGEACDRIREYFHSDQWLTRVVELCSSDYEWVTNWAQPTIKWFKTQCHYSCEWHLAPPNYVTHEWHVDALKQIVHGLMFVSPGDDRRTTTLFRPRGEITSWKKVRENISPISVSTGLDKGWLLLQNGRQEHRGINDSTTPRYVFKWMYTLKL